MINKDIATVQIRYIVNDVNAAISFYTKLLGFKLDMHPAPPFAMLSRGALRLVLSAPNPGSGGGQFMPDGTKPEPGGWNRFSIEVNDLANVVETLLKAGVHFRNDIVTGVGGKQIILEDPSGNPIELFEPILPEARLGQSKLQLTKDPAAVAEMLIRKPVAEVFEAFINPEITTKFWFTRSSGRLDAGKKVSWSWEMYNHSIEVTVKEVEKNKRILIEWPGYGSPTKVEWIFTPYGIDATFVSITNSGFSGDKNKIIEQALDSTGGFTIVLAGAKAWLEHGIRLNLIADRFPGGLREH